MPAAASRGRGRGRGRPGPSSSPGQSSTALVGRLAARAIEAATDSETGKEVSLHQDAESRSNRTTHNGTELPVGLPSSKDVLVLSQTSPELISTSPAGLSNAVPVGLPSSRDVLKMAPSGLQSSTDSSDRLPPGLPSSRDVLKMPTSGFSSSKDRTHETYTGNTAFKQRSSGVDRRRIVAANDERLVIQVNTESSSTINAVPKIVSPKSPKIGSGRLGRVEPGNANRKSSQQGRRKNQRRNNEVWKEEEPVMIGMAVIRTPGDDQSTGVIKGILKPSKETTLNKESVDDEEITIDWNKELAEAERRKAMEQLNNKSNAPQMEDMPTKDEDISSKDHALKQRAGKQTVNVKDNLKHPDQQKKNVKQKVVHVNESNEDDDEWEDVDEDADYVSADDDDEDLHDNSSESFDQFIKENTLKLDIECTPHVWPEHANDPLTPGSQSDSSSFLKTPTGLVHVVDWGAEMDAHSENDISASAYIRKLRIK